MPLDIDEVLRYLFSELGKVLFVSMLTKKLISFALLFALLFAIEGIGVHEDALADNNTAISHQVTPEGPHHSQHGQNHGICSVFCASIAEFSPSTISRPLEGQIRFGFEDQIAASLLQDIPFKPPRA